MACVHVTQNAAHCDSGVKFYKVLIQKFLGGEWCQGGGNLRRGVCVAGWRNKGKMRVAVGGEQVGMWQMEGWMIASARNRMIWWRLKGALGLIQCSRA